MGEIRDTLMPHGPVCPRCRSLQAVRYGRRRGRVNTADRVDPGPLYHVRNARRMLYDFRRRLRPFRGVATKYLLRYFSWYLRIATLAHTRAGAAAKLFSLEAVATHSLLMPG